MTTVVITLVIGIALILISPSVTRMQLRLWGDRQKAWLARGRDLADDPPALVVWAMTQVLIVGLTALFGVLLLLLPIAVAVIDISRGLRVEGFTLFVLMLMVSIGFPLTYLAVRAGSQVLLVLEGIGSTHIVEGGSGDPESDEPTEDQHPPN